MNTFNGKILIIGASAAGITAAKEIRKLNQTADISILTDEPHEPYYRPFLTEYISNPAVVAKPNFYLNPRAWYQTNNIQLSLGEKVTAINPVAKTARTAQDREWGYDKLILANGSNPFVPVPGILAKENVFAIRTFEDAQKVAQYARTAQRAVVIGGGVLGIETAHALVQKQLQVTIIELANRILPLQLDEEGALVFQAALEKHGVELKLNTLTEAFAGQAKVSAITLKSGEELPADMVLFCIGVRANLELAVGCGLQTNRGVVVNEKMETSVPDIYACGDVAECGRNLALWTVAQEQGRIAGLNAIGEPAAFEAANYATRLQSFDTKIYSIGDVGRQEHLKNYTTLGRKIPAEFVYKQLYFKGDKLSGGILIGDIKKASPLSKAVNQNLSLPETLALLE